MKKYSRAPKKLGERIKTQRMKLKITQEELAARVGLSVAYIGFIEQGIRTPSLKTLDKIARSLETEMSKLLD